MCTKLFLIKLLISKQFHIELTKIIGTNRITDDVYVYKENRNWIAFFR